MTDNYWMGIAIVLGLIVLDAMLWWFPGIALAFFVGRWSTS